MLLNAGHEEWTTGPAATATKPSSVSLTVAGAIKVGGMQTGTISLSLPLPRQLRGTKEDASFARSINPMAGENKMQ